MKDINRGWQDYGKKGQMTMLDPFIITIGILIVNSLVLTSDKTEGRARKR